jgi:hypothetical protein
MKSIILTYDYEVYFGSPTSDPVLSLYDNTERILNILMQENKRAVFFIDTLFLINLKKHESKLFELFKNQILKMNNQGNEIGLHLHPHWLDSEYIGSGKWIYSHYNQFRVSSLDEYKLDKLVHESLLILREISDDIEIVSFRAGGWCAQPFNKLSSILIKYGIKIDSSVVPFLKNDKSTIHYYDYTKCPNKSYWRFNDDLCLEVKDGQWLEVPVTTLQIPGVYLLINKILMKLNKFKYYYQGKGASGEDSIKNKFFRIFSYQTRKLSFESNSSWLIQNMFNRIQNEFAVLVMHPKTLSQMELTSMKLFLKNRKSVLLKELI